MGRVSPSPPASPPLLAPPTPVDEAQALLLTGRAPPPDRYRLVLGAFLLLGAGMLFPWNVFITNDAFWRAKLEGSAFAGNFQR
jgi:hypothetical protein